MTVCSWQLTNNICFIANSRTYVIFIAFGFLAFFSAAMPQQSYSTTLASQQNLIFRRGGGA